jgi:hypothetical protein
MTEPVPEPPKDPKPPKEPEPPKEPKEPKEPKPLPDPKPIPDPTPIPEPPVVNDPSQDFEPPTEIPVEELPTQPQAPGSAVGGDAVTTVGDVKFGWQDPPIEKEKPPAMCYHIGTVAAKSQLKEHAIGHEWVCTCGTVFVVTINAGGKKTLVEKTEVVDGQE